MLSKRDYRWYIAMLIGTALALFSAGAVVAAQLRLSETPEALDSAIRSADMTRVADIPAAEGAAKRGVFVQRTGNGLLCLSDAASPRSTDRGGGCNLAADPLGGKELFISLAYEGGPKVADVQDARLIGLVSSTVSAVEVLMNDGSRRGVQLRNVSIDGESYGAFGYRFKRADLKRGVSPTAVVALDPSGREIDRQATGFAG